MLGLLQNMLTVLADHIVREGTYSGRRAVLFATNSQYGTLGEWIDEKSLLPLGFVLPEIRVAGQPEFEPILAREVQITALNPEDTIVKPDGVCTEG